MDSRNNQDGNPNVPDGGQERAPESLNSPSGAKRKDDRREIRVFISSTFRDMMQECDLLVKQVFPALRRKCAARFVTFTEVDLRWGITEEQTAEGQVLPLCLAEIERSRPYFLGLLGERYGWIPETIQPEIIAREPWLQEHVRGRTSVTELEILHGVLNNPAMSGHAFFYFRDPAYAIYPDLTAEERAEMVERDIPAEIENLGPGEAARRTQERREKLAALKERIRVSGLPLADPYAGPEALAKIIEKQFAGLIDAIYPEDKTPDPLAQERLAHEAHAKNKLFAWIDRPAHLAALTGFSERADHGGKGLAVTGESGGGKTALLAAWAANWGGDHPGEFLFQHYFGATPDSSSPDGFLRRLLGELKARFGIAGDIPADPDKLREALPLWLALIPRDAQVLLVLDGLNQLRGADPDRHLRFLPRSFPPHVTVFASALPGPALDALRERGWVEHDVPRASAAEVDAMVAEYFRLHGRHVDAEGRPLQTALRRQLVAATGCKNPLFLRTVLEELRQFGSFEQLPAQVTGYLQATTPQELFLAVPRRWQEDFDGKNPAQENFDLTRRALTHLWAAREGLSESEWLDLLGSNLQPFESAISFDGLGALSLPKRSDPESAIETHLARAFWSPLFLALEPHLSQRAGLFAFGHDFLRQAVEVAFVAGAEAQRAAHLAVADYFEHHAMQRELTPRKAAEWPFQLHAAEAWARLEACLTDIPLFLALYNDRTKWELTGYWHPLRKQGREMDSGYTAAYERWISDSAQAADYDVPAQVGGFLLDNGLYAAAEPLLERALAASERVLGAEHPSTLTSVNNLAGLLESKGDYAGAQPLYERALEASERALGAEHPDTLSIVNNLAYLLESKGDYAGGQPLLERALAARERVLGAEHPDTLVSVNNLADVLEKTGRVQESRLYRIRSAEATAQNANASPLQRRGAARQLYQIGNYTEAANVLEQLLIAGFEIPGTCLHLARLFLMTDELAKARQHAAEAWTHRLKAPPYVLPRILWFHVLFALLDGADPSGPLGRIKTLFRSEGTHSEWAMDPVLAHLEPGIDPKSHKLLVALVAALNFPEKDPDLDRFPEWRNAAPQPLE